MDERRSNSGDPILPVGTQIVTLRNVVGQGGKVLHPAGAVGVIVRAPRDIEHAYRVRFVDGVEEALRAGDVVTLARFKGGELDEPARRGPVAAELFERAIFRCVIGSRAYGLDDEQSDTDYRGVFLPAAEAHWSLYGVPGQIERQETQEQYWELQRFLVLALKANPNVLECLFTPLVEFATPLGEQLLQIRGSFLSRLVYQTYNGYVMSQFKKMQADLRNQGELKPKHVMHLIRLLLAGIQALSTGVVPVRVEQHRDRLLAIRRGEVPWAEIECWRLQLHQEFDRALSETKLPERPDYQQANDFLIQARRLAVQQPLP